jgi:hypothetical protein
MTSLKYKKSNNKLELYIIILSIEFQNQSLFNRLKQQHRTTSRRPFIVKRALNRIQVITPGDINCIAPQERRLTDRGKIRLEFL